MNWVAGFEFPGHACAADMLAVSRPGTYPIERGTVITRSGRAFPAAGWDEHVIEKQVPHSTALHAHLAGGGRTSGPLTRYTLNSLWLSPLAREAARAAGLGPVCDNPFRSIIVRAVEAVYAIEEALRLIAAYDQPARPAVEVRPRAAVGHGVTEAPRGTLHHRYQIGADGLISTARIVPPHVPEPGRYRGRPARLRAGPDRPGRRRAHPPVRAGDPQLRPVHLLLRPLPDLTVERS